ncbi:MAG: flagellar type III secretion system pore protein FliP [Verrucomicrobia bacterium]|nr:flagellar type III secretion system pore protein FliP [Verrucomicrobiota bacterium]
MRFSLRTWLIVIALVAAPLLAVPAWSASPVSISIDLGEDGGRQQISSGLMLVALLTVLSIAPALLVLLTSFTRIVIVLSFLKRALSTGSQPSNQVLVSLALFLTFFIMAPVWQQVHTEALQPYLQEQIEGKDALAKGLKPIRDFMWSQTREKDLALFVQASKMERPKSIDDVPTHVLIPAFVLSELRTAFTMGFVLFLPFLVIDMVVASVLLSMGMMMLPPVMVSLPFKILLFIMVDGWFLMMRSLMASFGTG